MYLNKAFKHKQIQYSTYVFVNVLFKENIKASTIN